MGALATIMPATGLEYQMLKAMCWVAGIFEMVRRRTNLSWSHHREVAGLNAEDQDKWLDKAAVEVVTSETTICAETLPTPLPTAG